MLNFLQYTRAFLAQMQQPAQKAVETATESQGGFSWELAATILGVAALVIGAIVQIFMRKQKEDPEVLKHVNALTQIVNEHTTKQSETNAEIAALKANVANLVKENEELKQLIRDIERDNFNALSKVVDKVDNIKDLLITFKPKK